MDDAIVHPVAQKGFGMGTNDLYDRARPSYQPFLLSHIRSAVKKSTSLNIVECRNTRALLHHPEWCTSINEIKAVEPSEGMRNVFVKTVTDSRVSISEGMFERTTVSDGWADLVIIAQAFHCCTKHDHAAAEFARILKPHGTVVFVWNLEDK